MKSFLTSILMVAMVINSFSQEIEKSENESTPDPYYSHSVETSPMSLLLNVYGVLYYYRFSLHNEIITGINYSNLHYDFGNHNAPGMTIGYRRFLWKNLHFQYELWPAYDNFYEKNEDKHYKDFTLWNELRFGYQFNFKIKNQACYVSAQWPFGFFLVNGDKPKSYTDYEKDNRFFYQIPVLFIGLKF